LIAMVKTWLATTVAAVAFSGCATIVNGPNQKIPISSTPTGAAVVIDDKFEGTTPTVATLRRETNHFVKIALSGYDPVEVSLHSEISGWVWWNILFGLIGIAIDASTGAGFKLTPEELAVDLKQQK